jgi:hypothetical protein
MTQEEIKQYLEKMVMETLTVESDESEGTQSISLDFINACSPDYTPMDEPVMTAEQINHMLHLDDPSIFPDRRQPNRQNVPGDIAPSAEDENTEEPDDSYPDPGDDEFDKMAQAIIDDKSVGPMDVIVEFAQPCIRDPRGVDYKLSVKPGQSITADTIIGSIKMDEQQKLVRSIFSSGTVAATEDGNRFKRIMEETGANRHIIIENCELSGDIPEVHTEHIDEITEQFKKEAYLFEFITGNLCESSLPWILGRRYDSWIPPFLMGKPIIMRPNGRELFADFMEYVNEIRETYKEDLEKMTGEDSIRSSADSVSSLNSLGYRIIERRKKYYRDIVNAWKEHRNTIAHCEYDQEYSDCKYMAYAHDVEWGYKETTTFIGSSDYNNYYVTLMSLVDMRQEDNPYAKEYYSILTDIIGTRISSEGYPIDEIINEFNSNYDSNLGGGVRNPFMSLDSAMKATGKEIKYADVCMWINEHSTVRDHYTDIVTRQMANIYMFVRNYDAKKYVPLGNNIRRKEAGSSEEDNSGSIFELTKQECKHIEEFWKKCISEYEKLSIDDMIKNVKDLPDKVNQFAVWPPERIVSIDGRRYVHYLFQNTKNINGSGEKMDDSLGTDVNDKIPEEPTEVTPPEVGPEILPLNDNDPHEDEISIRDYEYWVRYFALATVISLPFLNCGLDFPPTIMFIPLPCIFICLGVVYMQQLDVVMVFGLSIRGMYIWPVVLFVNASNQFCNVMTPIVALLRSIQSKINLKIQSLADLPIQSLADKFINQLEEENRNLRRQNKQMEIVLDQIQARKTEGQEYIKAKI